MRKMRKVMAALMMAVMMLVSAVPAMAAENNSEVSIQVSDAVLNKDIMCGENAIYFNVDSGEGIVQTVTASSYVTYNVSAYDAGGGTPWDRKHYLRIPTSVNLNSNYNGRFQYYNTVDGWKDAGQGNLVHSKTENGYHYWGLNTWFTANFSNNWKSFSYRYIY